MSIKIFEFNQSFSRMPDQSGHLVFEGTEDLVRFAKRLIQQFHSLKATHGMDGYQDTWGYPFPDNQVNRLSRSLEKIWKFNNQLVNIFAIDRYCEEKTYPKE